MSKPDRSLFAFYFNAGVREIIPIYPLYSIMFGTHGVTPFELSLLFIIWGLTGFVFEVPSGAVADRYSRKWLIVVSAVFKAAGFYSWYAWQDFWGFAFGFMLWGFGSTLRSGAWEALLHDLLKSWDRDLEFTRHYGRIAALATFGVAIGELAGGLLIINGYDIVLLVSMVVPLIASIPFIFLVYDVPKVEGTSEEDYLETLKEGILEAVQNKIIFYILLAVTFLIVIAGVYDEYVSPNLYEKGFSLSMVAFLGVVILMSQSAGQAFAHYLYWLTLPQLLSVIAAGGALLIMIPFLGLIWMPILLAVFFAIFGLASTLFQSHLQSVITGDARATVTSTVYLGETAGAVLWFLVFGILAEFSSMSYAALGLGVIVVGLCLLFHLLARRWSVSR